MTPTARSVATARLEGFDASRGVAMLMVCLSHFMSVYFMGGSSERSDTVGLITLIASPTFIALSGIMLGVLSTAGDARSQLIRVKLADRGLFLLVVAHPLLALMVPFPRHTSEWFHWLGPTFITDAIGVSILVSLWLVPQLSVRARTALGVSTFGLSWAIIVGWHPIDSFDLGFKEILFGSLSYQYFPFSWPLLPWLSAYLVCTAFGEALAERLRSGERERAERPVLLASAVAFSVAVAGYAVHDHQRVLHASQGTVWWLDPLFAPLGKWPPSPEYFLFFGGFGLALLWSMLVCARRGWAKLALREAARVGRCSLAIFVAQALIYYRVVPMLGLSYTRLWPAIFVATLVPLYMLARVWDDRQLNSVLSVGLGRWLRREPDRLAVPRRT